MNKDLRTLLAIGIILLILPWILPNRYQVGLAMFIGINTLIVIGLNLLLGYAGQISLGHAAFYGLGAYACGILTTKYQLSPWLALLIALVFVGLVAAFIGRPTLRLKGHYLAMATMGFGIIVQTLFAEMSWLTKGAEGLDKIPSLRVFGFVFSSELHFYYLIWALVLLVQWCVIQLVKGKIGRALLAIHSNEAAAQALGIDLARQKLQIFVLSAVLAGLAGGVYAFTIRYINPETFGSNFSILLVTMVMVGGMGNLWGPLVGAPILSIIPDLLRNAQNPLIKDSDTLIYGLFLMVVIIFMPQGLVYGWRRLRDRLVRLWSSVRKSGKPDAEKGSGGEQVS